MRNYGTIDEKIDIRIIRYRSRKLRPLTRLLFVSHFTSMLLLLPEPAIAGFRGRPREPRGTPKSHAEMSQGTRSKNFAFSDFHIGTRKKIEKVTFTKILPNIANRCELIIDEQVKYSKSLLK